MTDEGLKPEMAALLDDERARAELDPATRARMLRRLVIATADPTGPSDDPPGGALPIRTPACHPESDPGRLQPVRLRATLVYFISLPI